MPFLLVEKAFSSTTTYEQIDSIGVAGGSADGELLYPNGVAVSSGYIYIADTDNHRIQKFDSDGIYYSKVGGPASSTADGQFDEPFGVAVDSLGNLYTVEKGNHRIQKLDSSFNFVWKIGGTASGSTNTEFKDPTSIILDLDGNLLISDTGNNRIMKFDTDGNFLMKFGTLGYGNGNLNAPIGLAVDSSNNIYVSDTGNSRIQKFTENGVFISIFGLSGYDSNRLNNPKGIAIGPDGDYYISDANNGQVKRFKPDGTLVYEIPISSPRQIVFDNTGKFYVVHYTNHLIKRYSNTFVQYQIINLNSNLDITRRSDDLGIELSDLWGTTGDTAAVRLKDSNGLTLSDLYVDLTGDREWSAVVGDSNSELGKSYVNNLIGAPGADISHSLYVPIPQGRFSSSVFICPNATSLEDVSLSCPNGVSRTAGTYSESFGEITINKASDLGDFNEYWKIDGMTGSGGIAQDFTAYSGSGLGTDESPYLITNCDQVQEINDNRGSVFQIAADIDCSVTATWNSGNGFEPIGTSLLPFTGKLIGSPNYEISGLTQTIDSENNGLFAFTNNAVIDDVHLTNILMTKGINGFGTIGGLIANMNGGEITNSSVSGAITQTVNDWEYTNDVGGLVGVIDGGLITNSSTDIDITLIQFGANNVGGLIGRSKGNVQIDDSFTLGEINLGHDSYDVGGVIGFAQGNTIINRCYSNGSIHIGIDSSPFEGDSYDIGGFAGGIGGSFTDSGLSSIIQSYSNSNIIIDGASNFDVGGFIGTVYDGGFVNNSYSNGTVTGLDDYNNGFGGFVGLTRQRYVSSPPVITHSYSTGDVSIGIQPYEAGGFIGEHRDGSISDSFTTSDLTVQVGAAVDDYGNNFGGFAGGMSSASIYDSYATGNVVGSGNSTTAGGFLGWAFGGVDIQRCASFGDVTVSDIAGGFVGFTSYYDSKQEYASIVDSFSRSDVTLYGSAEFNSLTAGGFVGSSDRSHFENSYATGLLTYDLNSLTFDPYVYIGGFIGFDELSSVVTNSYWDNQTSGILTSSLGSGISTVLMKTQSSFNTWDFDDTWSIESYINDGYPHLGFQKHGLINVELSSGLLNGFAPNIFNYTISTTDLDNINFNLDVINTLVTGITINGIPVTSGITTPNFSLVAGSNVFTIIISSIVAPGISPNSTYTYTITVNNEISPATPPVENDNDTNNGKIYTYEIPDKTNSEKPQTPPVITPPVIEKPEILKPIVDKVKETIPFNLSPEGKVGAAFLSLLLFEALASQLGLLKGNIWYALVALMDKIKKRKPWGVVYDSISKRNQSRAIIRLISVETGALVDTVVSDGLGIFKLAVKEGIYKLSVTKFGYLFPSKTIITNIDGNITNVYNGGNLNISKDNQMLMISVPIDPENESLLKKVLLLILNIVEKLIQILSPVILLIAFIYSLNLYNLNPNSFNLFAVYIYAFILLIKGLVYILNPKEFGKVVDRKNRPVSDLELGLYDFEFDRLVSKTVTDSKGKYNFVVPNKNYKIRTVTGDYQIDSGEKTVIKSKDTTVKLINSDLRIHAV